MAIHCNICFRGQNFFPIPPVSRRLAWEVYAETFEKKSKIMEFIYNIGYNIIGKLGFLTIISNGLRFYPKKR
jgi:hypothetical protein